jgi:TusA-related sulfurtransferase/rhodanese-related sulfurtransferase
MVQVNHIDGEGLERLRQQADVVVVDVRTDAEVARGMIGGARHIPLHLLPLRCDELDPARTIVVYCQSGGRSGQACGWLAERGYEVYNLQGGVMGWLREGTHPRGAPAVTGKAYRMSPADTAPPDRELDARGLNCPLPILRTKKALNEMALGQVLRIVATDPGSVRDFQAFSRQTGHELLSSEQTAGEFCFLLRKKK